MCESSTNLVAKMLSGKSDIDSDRLSVETCWTASLSSGDDADIVRKAFAVLEKEFEVGNLLAVVFDSTCRISRLVHLTWVSRAHLMVCVKKLVFSIHAMLFVP